MDARELDAVKIAMASPDLIRRWSQGRVVSEARTINSKTGKPETGGLFCEQIFGPATDRKRRRERMARIDLAAPVCHIWYLQTARSPLALLLDIPLGDVKRVIYFDAYIVMDPGGDPNLRKHQLLTETQYRALRDRMHELEELTPEELGERTKTLRRRLKKSDQERADVMRQLQALEVVEAGRAGGEEPDGSRFGVGISAVALTTPSQRPTKKEQRETVKALRERLKTGDRERADIAGQLGALEAFKAGKRFTAGTGAEAIKTLLEELTPERLQERAKALREQLEKGDQDPAEIVRRLKAVEREEARTELHQQLQVSDPERAEIVRQLEATELPGEEAERLRRLLRNGDRARKKIVRQLKVVEAFRKSDNEPSWMILDVLPVLPPDLRPMVRLGGRRFATTDLNDLYISVITRNNHLRHLLKTEWTPENILNREKRLLQEAVDALIDNGHRGAPQKTGPNDRPLRSLSDMLRGKQGRFRNNLLGKRVDYSGRAVIVVNPALKLHQCGLPREMALELFKPFVTAKLGGRLLSADPRGASRLIERGGADVWDALAEVVRERPVLLNRQPTLHRLGIQAFEAVLVEGKAIQVHPLVCPAYNADFDGDTMAVHVPLSLSAVAEAQTLMLSTLNLLSPASGRPIALPTLDIVFGCYYLTLERPGARGEGKVFRSANEAVLAYENGVVDLHASIRVRLSPGGEPQPTTAGRVIFNEAIPEELRLIAVGTNTKKKILETVCTKKILEQIVAEAYSRLGPTKTVQILERIKDLGFHYATVSGSGIAFSDIAVPQEKDEILAEARKKVDEIQAGYQRGELSREERYHKVVAVWGGAVDEIKRTIENRMTTDPLNPLSMMAESGARGTRNQDQIAGMLGLVTDSSGKAIETPITANYREGLTLLEYFTSVPSRRRSLANKALETPDAGYLTRRLVEVAHDVVVRDADCGAPTAIEMTAIDAPLEERIMGRVAAADIIASQGGDVLVWAGQEIDEAAAEAIQKAGIPSVSVRSVLTCRTRNGVCATCYGWDLATRKRVELGQAVGIIAAQSIGEPGTQLTLDIFHTGGGTGVDITQGLPRVEELFEARGQAVISEIDGRVHLSENKRARAITVSGRDDTREYRVASSVRLRVAEGDQVSAGDQLTEGSVNPHDILRIKGLATVQAYLVQEIQREYRRQGVEINEKHFEIIVRQMLRHVEVEDPGETDLPTGAIVDVFAFEAANAAAVDASKKPAVARRVLLGITDASETTESFLSAASFREPVRFLVEAAIQGKEDRLHDLKANVIVGKRIPAGTGLRSSLLDDAHGPEDPMAV